MARAELWMYEAYHGNLPDVCICCGRPATVFKTKAFSTGLLGLPMVIAFLFVVLAGKAWIRAPFCALHRNHWQHRTWIVWGVFLSLIAMAVASLWLIGEYGGRNRVEGTIGGLLCLGFFIGLVFWLALAFTLRWTGVYIAAIGETTLVLANVAPEFVEALEARRAAEIGMAKDTTFRRKPMVFIIFLGIGWLGWEMRGKMHFHSGGG